jgi:glycosyltransferase involved in cell wall biosynthesis
MTMDVERVSPEQRLRIAVLGDFDGPHARAWLRYFIGRGHDVHAISFYPPRTAIEGATMHALRRTSPPGPHSISVERGSATIAARVPRGLLRLAHGARYRMAGLRGVLRRIDPDVFHAHFIVEHGFYGALAGVHPLVVTAWGSDVLVEPRRDAISRLIARWTIGRADLVTSNNAYMARRIGALGALPAKVKVVTLGAERYDLERAADSVNRRAPDPERASTVISTRAHEPLYNISEIIDAHAIVARERPEVRLVVAHGGSRTEALLRRATAAGAHVAFTGFLDRAAFRDALAEAEIFVSVPSSDATSVALLQAMAAGAFPIVGDLPSQRELITDGVNGFLAPLHRPQALAERITRALADPTLRRTAAEINRRIVEERGLNETQMAKMEALYYRLSGRAPDAPQRHGGTEGLGGSE